MSGYEITVFGRYHFWFRKEKTKLGVGGNLLEIGWSRESRKKE